MIRRGSAILAVIAVALVACSVDPGTDRAGTLASDIRIDSVRFLPLGSRFVLRDSATPIAFLGYHAGYVCSSFLRLGLTDVPAGLPPAYRPQTQVRLPASDECPLDSGARDTAASHVFSEGSLIRLANTAGEVTDAATPVYGKPGSDSIRGVPDSGGTLSIGNVTYRNSGATGAGELILDSLPPCRYLNTADSEKPNGDTVLVRFSWVDFDPTTTDACDGPPHGDSSAVLPHHALRMAVPGTAK